MTDPVIRAFREAARHGISSIGEDRLKAMLSKWLDTDGPAAFRAAADSGTIVREDGSDNSGSPLWRLGKGVSETALMQRQPVDHGGRRGPHTAALLHLRARVLEARIRMRALPAAKFRPRPGEKPDPDGYFWRSTDTGRKYRIREGDDVRETVRRALPDGGSGGSPGGRGSGRPRIRVDRVMRRHMREAVGYLQDAIGDIPGHITDGLAEISIKDAPPAQAETGQYVPATAELRLFPANMLGGIDAPMDKDVLSSVLYHELAHHVWFGKYTGRQIREFRDEVKRLYRQTGSAITDYAGEHAEDSGTIFAEETHSELFAIMHTGWASHGETYDEDVFGELSRAYARIFGRRFMPKPMTAAEQDPDIVSWFTTRGGNRIPIRKGQTKADALREKIREWESRAGGDGSGGGKPGGKKPRKSGAGDDGDDTFRRRHAEGKRLLKKSPLKGASYSHKMGGTLANLKSGDTMRRFAEIYSINRQPVYIIAVTNNTGDFNRSTEDVYARLNRDGREAIMGKWIDETGTEFNDISMVMSGIGEDEALRYKRLYDQQEIIRVYLDGNYDSI